MENLNNVEYRMINVKVKKIEHYYFNGRMIYCYFINGLQKRQDVKIKKGGIIIKVIQYQAFHDLYQVYKEFYLRT